MINLLCDRSLMRACEKQTSRISEEHVVHAAGQLGQEIPKGKIKGDAEDVPPVPSRRGLVFAVLLLVILLAATAAAVALTGNPLAFLADGAPPPPRVEQRSLPAQVTPLPAPAGMPAPLPGPPVEGLFSILIGTYDSIREVDRVERSLRMENLPVYTIDVLIAPGDLRRRVMVGRFPTRDEAERVLATLRLMMMPAQVIPVELERLRETVP